jgi:hypothetical protein
MLHNDKRDKWLHDPNAKYLTAKLKGNVQPTMLCTIRVRSFNIIMTFKNNFKKLVYMEADSLGCELNKFHYTSNKIHNNILFHSQSRKGKVIYAELFMGRNYIHRYYLEFSTMDVNFIYLPI